MCPEGYMRNPAIVYLERDAAGEEFARTTAGVDRRLILGHVSATYVTCIKVTDLGQDWAPALAEPSRSALWQCRRRHPR
jgi:hypothetical protein